MHSEEWRREMAKITTSKIIGEFTTAEVRLMRYTLNECLTRWDITDDEDRRIAEELLDDLGGDSV
jgi:hypothetical protein